MLLHLRREILLRVSCFEYSVFPSCSKSRFDDMSQSESVASANEKIDLVRGVRIEHVPRKA